MGSVVLDCWEMSVVRYVRLYEVLIVSCFAVSQPSFSFRLLISPFEQHMGFIPILLFILYSLFFYLFNSFNSFPPFPLVGFRHRTNALGDRRSWRWSSPLLFSLGAPEVSVSRDLKKRRGKQPRPMSCRLCGADRNHPLTFLTLRGAFFAHVGSLSRDGGPRNETRSYSRRCGG